MPNTITAYTTFNAGTKARSGEVNSNFLNHRGTLIPINTNTATAADRIFDLGTSEHRWRELWIDKIRINSSTVTGASLTIVGTPATAGAMEFRIGALTACVMDPGGINRDKSLPFNFRPSSGSPTDHNQWVNAAGVLSNVTLGAANAGTSFTMAALAFYVENNPQGNNVVEVGCVLGQVAFTGSSGAIIGHAKAEVLWGSAGEGPVNTATVNGQTFFLNYTMAANEKLDKTLPSVMFVFEPTVADKAFIFQLNLFHVSNTGDVNATFRGLFAAKRA